MDMHAECRPDAYLQPFARRRVKAGFSVARQAVMFKMRGE